MAALNQMTAAGMAALVLARTAVAQEPQCIFSKHRQAAVQIEYIYHAEHAGTGRSIGSGFIVSPSGHVLTNAHVIQPEVPGLKIVSSSITVHVGKLGKASAYSATVSENDIDFGADLALLKLPDRPGNAPWPTLPISYIDALAVGAPLVGLGFPLGGDVAVTPQGLKTSDSTIIDNKKKAWWQTSVPLSKGNSGGPIFGKLGTVVGIAVAINRNSENLTYVIPIARAQHMLDKIGVRASGIGDCADFPACRHPSHGLEGYTVNETVSAESEWRQGGGNPKASQDAWCSDYLAQLQATYPTSSFVKLGSRDSAEGFDNALLRVGAKYKYICEYRRLEGPIYKEKKSVACLR